MRGSAAVSSSGLMTTVRRAVSVASIVLCSLTSCAGSSPSFLPTPNSSTLLLNPGDATFRVRGIIQEGGVRGSSSPPLLLDSEGYPNHWGTLIMESAEVHSSVECIHEKGRDTILNFGPKWTGPATAASPSRNASPYLPTRFSIGDLPLESLGGRRIQAWGSMTASATGQCTFLVVQYVELQN